MIEILFRGQRIDNGEWVYGYIVRSLQFKGWFIDFSKNERDYSEEVKPESIGKFSGLLDKNGNKIFEGDRVNFHYFYQAFVNGGAYESEKEIEGIVEIKELGLFLKCENEDEGGYLLFYQLHEESFEIIGNIHENNL
ncbi:hypothetical protein HXZ94_15710 [Empedobacter falsenii]|uniref:YopX family protein n=1 Tax=Empedobacter falsenii TaxID=343874 RepID=UPI002576E15F|nr:YopX family protein [Empedobacter falsenii]MDM1299941.1 hypothetical protein [Empedobacter falsenii]MDM1319734.1 hypothetical protein [Empedobacter falsenii]